MLVLSLLLIFLKIVSECKNLLQQQVIQTKQVRTSKKKQTNAEGKLMHVKVVVFCRLRTLLPDVKHYVQHSSKDVKNN